MRRAARIAVAVLIAPLATPLAIWLAFTVFYLLALGWFADKPYWLVLENGVMVWSVFATALAYMVTLVGGVPASLVLRKKRWVGRSSPRTRLALAGQVLTRRTENMVNDLSPRTARVLVAFLLAGPSVAGSVQSGQTLITLTVPAAALPNDCALTPPPAPNPAPTVRGGVTVVHGPPLSKFPQFPTNPWTGTDRKTVAAIHMAIDATAAWPRPPLPDAPPTTSRDAADAELKWADNILEAYHAAYTAVDGYQVEVFAVTFNDVKLTTAPESLSAMLNPRQRGFTTRFVRGATVVRVSALHSTDCFEAVRAYTESLK